jgi:hypothetical protein
MAFHAACSIYFQHSIPVATKFRTVLYRSYPGRLTAPINVNDMIGLDPDSSHTLDDYLHDLSLYDGVQVTERDGGLITFSDGEQFEFEERQEPVHHGVPLGDLFRR